MIVCRCEEVTAGQIRNYAQLGCQGPNQTTFSRPRFWIKDLERDFAGMNEVWDAWTAPGAAPTRATAQCDMGAPDILVEIIVTAASR